LVEEKYGGRLEDKSDELEGAIGHRVVMRFNSSDAKPDERIPKFDIPSMP